VAHASASRRGIVEYSMQLARPVSSPGAPALGGDRGVA
jgi:hypothetical protein